MLEQSPDFCNTSMEISPETMRALADAVKVKSREIRQSIYAEKLPVKFAESVNNFLSSAKVLDLTEEIALARAMLAQASAEYTEAVSLHAKTPKEMQAKEYAILSAKSQIKTWLDTIANLQDKYSKFFKSTYNQFNAVVVNGSQSPIEQIEAAATALMPGDPQSANAVVAAMHDTIPRLSDNNAMPGEIEPIVIDAPHTVNGVNTNGRTRVAG